MASAVATPGVESSIWDKLGDGLNSVVEGSLGFVGRMFGSANDRAVKSLGYTRAKSAAQHTVLPGSTLDEVNKLEERMQALTDDGLKEQTELFRARLAEGETLEALLPEAFAACREAAKRAKGMRHYDVQIVGGAILHGGNIAEMVTGEGKTLVATLPAYLNALGGKGVHVVTVNDYLARRDCEWMLPDLQRAGRECGVHPERHGARTPAGAAYDCEITYGTSSGVRVRLPPRQHEAGELRGRRHGVPPVLPPVPARPRSTTPSSTRSTTSSSTRPAPRSSSAARPSPTPKRFVEGRPRSRGQAHRDGAEGPPRN